VTRPTVGLGLIARDEELVLPRLLASCVGAFDEVVLVDTGSNDATVARFEAWAAVQVAVRTRVVRFPWSDDFSAARQVALQALASDWCTWADCDDVLVGAGSLRDVAARAPADVVAFTGRYDYSPTEFARHVRLLRRGVGRWRGAVHEALQVAGRLAALPDEVRWIHRPPDAPGPKPRLRRDAAILAREVAADPEDERAVFYLAQTHRDLGDTARAIELYEQRAAMTGWDEETFYARFQVGALLVDRDWPRAMTNLIAAWELRPGRLEPLQALSANLRLRGEYETADLFARRGLDVAMPADELFVATWVYDWGMLFERSVTAYWTGDVPAGLAACHALLARDDLPSLQRQQSEHNRQACVDAIARSAVYGPG
jgi:tetratricopeptide (TPR) repeat protein